MDFTEAELYMTHVICFHLQRWRGFEFKNGTFSSRAKCKQFNIHFPSKDFSSSKDFIWILSVLYFLLIGSASHFKLKAKNVLALNEDRKQITKKTGK